MNKIFQHLKKIHKTKIIKYFTQKNHTGKGILQLTRFQLFKLFLRVSSLKKKGI